jgi:hypothetical protein
MLPLRADSGSIGLAGSVAVDANDDRVRIEELGGAVVVRAEGDLRLLAGVRDRGGTAFRSG